MSNQTNNTTVIVDKPLQWDAWFVVAIMIIGGFVLMKDWVPVDITFVAITAILWFANIITIAEGSEGFSNSGVLQVAILMVCSHGLSLTGGLGYFASKILGNPKSIENAIVRIIIPMAIGSSFINDTPMFLMFIPILQSWAPKVGVDVRQFFIPLSFAAILPVGITLVGTSTNLVVAGRAATVFKNYPLTLFGAAPAGFPNLLFGLSYIFLFSYRLLPSKYKKDSIGAPDETPAVTPPANIFRCAVTKISPAIGKSITEAGLRNLNLLYLTSVMHGDAMIHAVDPEYVIRVGDILSFVGNEDKFKDICLQFSFDEKIVDISQEASVDEALVEASVLNDHVVVLEISATSDLIGKTPKDVGFREKFDASIISILKHNGGANSSTLGQTELGAGDILTVLVGPKFDAKVQNTSFQIFNGINGKDLAKTYTFGAVVSNKAKLRLAALVGGKTIAEAGLRSLPHAYLVAITRGGPGGEIVRNPPPTTVLNAGDLVWFSGDEQGIDTVRRVPGLELFSDDQARKLRARADQRLLVEVLIAPSSSLIGLTVKESKFRTNFGAAIVAIRRGGSNLETFNHISEVVLQVGDILMLDTGSDFATRYRKDPNFLIVSEVAKSSPPHFTKFYICLLAFALIFIIFVATDNKINLLPLGVAAAGIMIACRAMTFQQARGAVDWEVLVSISAAFGLGTAMEKTGLARAIAAGLVQAAILTGSGEGGIIAAIYAGTALTSLIVANNAAGLIMLTIAAETQRMYGLSPYKIIYAVMFGANANFAIAYSYQTHIMCMNLGPYTNWEFVKFGLPLQILMIPVATLSLLYLDQWYIMNPIAIAVFLVATVYALCTKGHPTHPEGGTSIEDTKTLGRGSSLTSFRWMNRV